jgi:hypothetical protein
MFTLAARLFLLKNPWHSAPTSRLVWLFQFEQVKLIVRYDFTKFKLLELYTL